ncbi:hypothetical protein CTheo_8740 [Ceratobasidium theobromae]|uniref:Uncharacterized protein n=1 Tax=Ceratobasidium theobromae TaxID=1582974 RepID=A0A5N5Q804_9AGAM|nr:hypothetical protein CTheo_8740 [Ceratobasidium theobromae]
MLLYSHHKIMKQGGANPYGDEELAILMLLCLEQSNFTGRSEKKVHEYGYTLQRVKAYESAKKLMKLGSLKGRVHNLIDLAAGWVGYLFLNHRDTNGNVVPEGKSWEDLMANVEEGNEGRVMEYHFESDEEGDQGEEWGHAAEVLEDCERGTGGIRGGQ